ncbi:MAG: BrnT family toxin, partial [Chloroflexi bacterium]|nr:BrnT family toxin [Chloroflexota bacterium]
MQKRGLSFETAKLVFADPLLVQRPDPHLEEERWLTIGLVGNVVAVVSTTSPSSGTGADPWVWCIISARKTTAHERRRAATGSRRRRALAARRAAIFRRDVRRAANATASPE